VFNIVWRMLFQPFDGLNNKDDSLTRDCRTADDAMAQAALLRHGNDI